MSTGYKPLGNHRITWEGGDVEVELSARVLMEDDERPVQFLAVSREHGIEVEGPSISMIRYRLIEALRSRVRVGWVDWVGVRFSLRVRNPATDEAFVEPRVSWGVYGIHESPPQHQYLDGYIVSGFPWDERNQDIGPEESVTFYMRDSEDARALATRATEQLGASYLAVLARLREDFVAAGAMVVEGGGL